MNKDTRAILKQLKDLYNTTSNKHTRYAIYMSMKYIKAWNKLYHRLMTLKDIDHFHGLFFKDKIKVTVEYLLSYMDNCIQ